MKKSFVSKNILASPLIVLAMMCGVCGSAEAQVENNPAANRSVVWLKNKRRVPFKKTSVPEYSEDAYYGIEKIERDPLNKEHAASTGEGKSTGSGIGNGIGNGMGSGLGSFEENPLPENEWLPYYDRPSNCSTANYQPEVNPKPTAIEPNVSNRPARLEYQPRPLYSQTDYAARRAGAIRVQVQLKADGTIGKVRAFSRLPGDLTQSALRAACYVTFHPAIAGGKPVDSVQTITYDFKPGQVAEIEPKKPSLPDNQMLKIISKPRPEYTDEAKTNQRQGTISLRVTFLASGKIGAVEPVDTLPDGLTEKAVEAAHRMRFEPARKNGRNITVVKLVSYNFWLY